MTRSEARGPGWPAHLLLALCAVALPVALAELLSWLYIRWERPELRPWPDPPAAVERVPNYGYVLPSNRTIHAVKHTPDGETCYDVTYRTDAFGRRTVRQAYDPSHPHMILFGCSVAMGEGLDDPDTLAAHLEKTLPGYNIYDYAASGYGPQHMLARLQSRTLAAEVASGEGVALYVLLPMHVSRAIADTRAFWLYGSPYYRLDDGDGLRRHGSFDSDRPFRTSLYRFIVWLKGHSWFLTLFDVNLPVRLSDRDTELTARILEDARQEYRAQFRGELYVVFHPTWTRGNSETEHLFEVIRDHLAAARVPLLDYSTDRGLADAEKVNPACDQHPNGRLNAELAALLARDLPAPR